MLLICEVRSEGYLYTKPVDSYGNPVNPASLFSHLKNEQVDVETFRSISHGYNEKKKVVQKHIFVHEPPSDPKKIISPRPIFIQPPQKHYKIIFVKSPTQATTPPAIPLQPQIEQKTLIYVLVQKPDEQPEIKIPTPPPTPPSKPEVYFIRYKSKTEKTKTKPPLNEHKSR